MTRADWLKLPTPGREQLARVIADTENMDDDRALNRFVSRIVNGVELPDEYGWNDAAVIDFIARN